MTSSIKELKLLCKFKDQLEASVVGGDLLFTLIVESMQKNGTLSLDLTGCWIDWFFLDDFYEFSSKRTLKAERFYTLTSICDKLSCPDYRRYQRFWGNLQRIVYSYYQNCLQNPRKRVKLDLRTFVEINSYLLVLDDKPGDY